MISGTGFGLGGWSTWVTVAGTTMSLPNLAGLAKQPTGPEHDHRLGREWVDVLREVPLFAAVPKRHLARIAKTAQAARFHPGTTIVREGSRGEAFYLILDGKARVSARGKRSVQLGLGDFFGEMALFDGSPRSATVTAESPVLVMKLTRRRFVPLVQREPKIALALLRTLASRVRESERGA